MSVVDLSDFMEKSAAHVARKRAGQVDRFVEWFLESGLSPLDYYLVEEKRTDGARIWSFQRKDASIAAGCAEYPQKPV